MTAAMTSPSPSQIAHQSSFCQSSLQPCASAGADCGLVAVNALRADCFCAMAISLFPLNFGEEPYVSISGPQAELRDCPVYPRLLTFRLANRGIHHQYCFFA